MTRLFPTLRARLMLLVLLALVPACALLAQLGGHYYRFVVSSAYQNAGSLAALMAAEQQRKVEDMRQMLVALAKTRAIRDRRDGYCGEFSEVLEQRSSEFVGIGLTDAHGRILCGAPARAGAADGFAQEWFRKALASREFSVAAYQIEADTDKSVALAVLPLSNAAGEVQGALYAALDLAWITRVNALASLPERSILLMFDQSGLVLQRNPDPQQWVGGRHPDSPFLKGIMARGDSGVLEMPALDGIRRLVAFRTLPSQSGRIYLVVGIPSEIAFEQIDKELAATVVWIALAIAATLAIAWLAGDKLVTDRVRRLARAARQFGEGVRDVRSGLPYLPDEIGQLARAFDNMVGSIERREEQLKRYYLALDEHAIVSATDVDGNIIHVNDRFCEISGYTREELMGQNHRILKTELLSAETARRMWETISQGKVWHSNVCNRNKAGGRFWVTSTIMPFMDEAGRPTQYIAIRTDITETVAVKDALQLRDRAIQASPSGIVLFSTARGKPVVYANEAFETITGFDTGEIYGRSVWRLARRLMDSDNVAKMRAADLENGELRVSIQFTRRDGVRRWADCSVAPIRNEQGEATHYVAAVSDVTARVMMVEELIRAKEASEQAYQAKSEFLARMTHELRTPLNAILGFAQLLQLQPERLTPSQLDGIDRLIKSGWHLRELIDEVLDLSRIEAGRMEIQLEDVDAHEVLQECTAEVAVTAAGRRIGIAVEPAQGSAQVRADRKRLKQVLLNLLSNAVKFNRDEGRIAVGLAGAANGRLRITVSDTGPGIEPRRQGELFQPFSRLDADRAEIPGTGIGLAISRRFVHLMGGEIGVDSAPGRGSAFWIELPRAETESAQTQEVEFREING